jgi:hypothetical protein
MGVCVLQFSFTRAVPHSRVPPPAQRSSARRLDGTFRAHARTRVSLRALVTHVERGWQRHVRVEDIGLGGARILVEDAVRPGDAVTVSFTAPSLWDPLVLRARVAWVSLLAAPAPLVAGASIGPSPGGSRPAGIAFDVRSGPAAFALFELISAVGYE